MDKILLKDIRGGQWLFRFDGAGRLCYSKNGSAEHILAGDATEEFDLATDGEGNFHLVVQTADGSLIYLTYDFNNWKKYVILQSKSNRSAMSGFKIFVAEGKIHCFYKLLFKGKAMLVHHIFSPAEPPGEPNVVAYMAASESFSCAMDTDSSIHIFYFDEARLFHYKVYGADGYTDSSLPVEDDIRDICCICGEGGLHLLYTANVKAYCTLIYYNPNAGERKIISFGDSNISACCVYTEGKNVHVQWRERTRCYRCSSADGGVTFKKPAPIPEGRGKLASTIRLRSAHNPKGLECDRRIVSGTDVWEGAAHTSGKDDKIHTPAKNDYNIIEAAYPDEMKIMQSKIRENEKELIRLNAIISTLSDKISALTKNSVKAPPPSPTPQTELLSGEDVGEVDMKNYQLFKNILI